MTAYERLLQAVEFNPERSRVTVPRQAVRDVLSHNQRLAADVERLTTGAVTAEFTMADQAARIASQGSELSYRRDRAEAQAEEMEDLLTSKAELRRELDDVATDSKARADEAASVKDALDRAPTWIGFWMGWCLVPVSLFGEYALLHWHG